MEQKSSCFPFISLEYALPSHALTSHPKRKRTQIDGSNKAKKTKLDGPNPPPGMPEEIKNLISEFVGGNRAISMEKLVMQRKLESNEVKGEQNRLIIPRGNLMTQFLQGVEKYKKYQLVNVIDPSLNDHIVNLSKWNKNKPFRVLNGSAWKKIVETNSLEAGMIMQLWAVRACDELWPVLVNLTPPIDVEEASDISSEDCSTY